MASSKTKGKSEFINSSMNVKVEGKAVVRAMDMVLHNDKNTPPVPVLQPPIVAIVTNVEVKSYCPCCSEEIKDG